MKRDRLDVWLERLTYGVALVRVLRGDDPAEVSKDVERMNEKAVALRDAIAREVGEPIGPQRSEDKRRGGDA